ncbi:MAG: ATP-binding protein [Jatrophihabitans sp.]
MSTLWVKHAPASAAVARKSVQAAFHRAGLSSDDAFDAALITSELVGNAVRHAAALPSGHLAIEWSLEPEGYLISVTDGGSQQPVTRRIAQARDINGRGLMIVDALSRSWGVRTDPDSTTVWARGTFQQAGSRSTELQPAH